MHKRGASNSVIAAAIVLLVAFSGVGYFFLTQGTNSPPSSTQSTMTTSSKSTIQTSSSTAHSSTTSSSTQSSSRTSTTPVSSTVTCSSGTGGTVSVTASYFSSFTPQTINISVGQSVTWTNTDTGVYTYYHIVTSGTSAWTPQRIDPGQSVTCVFNTPGTYDYHCSVHAFMMGKVEVSS